MFRYRLSLSFCLSVYLSVCLSVCLSVRMEYTSPPTSSLNLPPICLPCGAHFRTTSASSFNDAVVKGTWYSSLLSPPWLLVLIVNGQCWLLAIECGGSLKACYSVYRFLLPGLNEAEERKGPPSLSFSPLSREDCIFHRK